MSSGHFRANSDAFIGPIRGQGPRLPRRCDAGDGAFLLFQEKKEGEGEVMGVEASSFCGVAVRRTVAIIHRS